MKNLTGLRRVSVAATSLAAVAALALGSAFPAQAAGSDRGLFGTADATYDGTYRQSLGVLGLQAAGAKVPAAAIRWLTTQQCPDGSFVAYRADTSLPCPAADPDNFTGPDTNSTSLAAMALASVGQYKPATRAARWLMSQQNGDGGWGYISGAPSDANSTGLVLAALNESTDKGAAAEKRGLRYLRTLASDCATGAASLSYQTGQAPNPLASAQALLGLNTGLPIQESPSRYTKAQRCDERLDQRVAQYLANELKANGGILPSSLDATTKDYNTTAWAVIGLVGANWPKSTYSTTVKALQQSASTYVGTGTDTSPAAAGTLALVAEYTGIPAKNFGGVNLVSTLLRSMQS